MNRISFLLLVFIFTASLQNIKAQGLSPRFKIYFNQPVDTSVSTGTPAQYVNGTIMDTLVYYINNAQYTIDIAQYDYNQDSYFINIATALNNAYTRGVRVRWIYDGSSSNTGLVGLNSGIHTLASPTTSNYGIMHNKFVIIDANSPDSTRSWLNTSSMDWSGTMVDYDYNNIVFIQSQPLAQAYTAEFNMMWGDTTAVPDSANSKFGPYKTDLGLHNFTIDGIQVNLYFSPSDGTNDQVLNTIATADSELCFGVYDMTQSNDAQAIIAKYQAGVTTYGILDQYSASNGGQYSTLSTALGSNLKEYVQSNSIYHNKFMFVDACSPSSDPQVLTGSYNWTKSGDEYNDENIIIMHDPTIANLYYQSFYQNFKSLSGTMTPCTTTTGINTLYEGSINIYPNPTTVGYWQMDVTSNWVGAAWVLSDLSGKVIEQSEVADMQTTITTPLTEGIYFVKLQKNGQSLMRKLVKL